jgi:hypothetical protein
MGEEKQFGVVGGNPDPGDMSGARIHGWTKADFTANGNLVRPRHLVGLGLEFWSLGLRH